ncbi:hypothetical protein [Endozoicomonas sp. ALD040]|uniref:hypothetical protein n=1 Tax=Endozoicomonas sp. ALD040 TaxID=3403079 RepID=UPI003BAFD8DD
MRRCITAPSEQYKLALAVSMVAMLELYGFLIYALMASYISGHFFPASDQLTSLLGSFAALAARYLTRPLEGLFFGHLGPAYYLVVIGIISLMAVLAPWPDYDMKKNECLDTTLAEKG